MSSGDLGMPVGLFPSSLAVRCRPRRDWSRGSRSFSLPERVARLPLGRAATHRLPPLSFA